MLNHTSHIWEASDRIISELGAHNIDEALDILRKKVVEV